MKDDEEKEGEELEPMYINITTDALLRAQEQMNPKPTSTAMMLAFMEIQLSVKNKRVVNILVCDTKSAALEKGRLVCCRYAGKAPFTATFALCCVCGHDVYFDSVPAHAKLEKICQGCVEEETGMRLET